ncbi:MAG: hypothetical protein K0R03_1621 [Moraxellaceae bacterium]|jgi:hypothetical protein|nr:hypothetical protein [Moraxellaceae bacterium]MDF3031063.1 hypothetical protein [Moraxellaceae bacterium]
MTHRFNVKHYLEGGTLEETRESVGTPAFQEEVARKAPGFNLKILESTRSGNRYVMRREVNMDVDIPDIARRLLRDAFKVWRDEEWDLDTLTCRARTKMNLPAEFRVTAKLTQEGSRILANFDWEVDVNIPLVRGFLEKHAEGEIRRFNQLEMDVVQQVIRERMAG